QLLNSIRPSDLPWQMAAVGGFGDGLRARGGTSPNGSSLTAAAGNSTELKESLEKLFTGSAQIAVQPSESIDARQAAISLLGQADYSIAGPALEKLLDPQQPADIQI